LAGVNRSNHIVNLQDASCRPLRIAIVGGGPGGLFAAWHLERLAAVPVEITIFEATNRLGGKVLTPAFTAAPVSYEAGAAELYDYSPVEDDPLRALVAELGLPTVPLAGSAVYVAGRRIANLDDVGDALGPAARRELMEFDTAARGAMTPREFYDSGSDHAVPLPHGLEPARFADMLAGIRSVTARRYVETLIHSDLATEPARTSIGYGLQNYLMNDPATMRLYRIGGGNERLIAAVVERLAAEVRFDAAVTALGPGAGRRMAVAWSSDGRQQRDEFDLVILALPIGPLAALTCQDPVLGAALRRHVAHHDHPAHYLRISMLLDRPLPSMPGEDDFLMVDAFGGACLYVETARHPTATHGVVGWLVAGEIAAEQATRSDAELAAAAAAALPGPLAACRHHVIETRVHRWTGAVSALPGGWSPLPVDRRHRPSAAHPNLFVVGDYLFDSTLNGVLDSAEHVAGWVATELACPSVVGLSAAELVGEAGRGMHVSPLGVAE
jgi:protoporphyrinogen oxidase